jgi:hypothetical protein
MAATFDEVLVFCADDRNWSRAMAYAREFATGGAHLTALTLSAEGGVRQEIDFQESVVHCRATLPEAIGMHAAWADLIILDAASAALNLETIVVESSRPCIVLPTDPPRRAPRTIAIGWNGSTEAARAIKAALPLMLTAERIILLDADAAPHPLCSRPLRAESFLARHGLHYLHLRSAGDTDTAGRRLLELAVEHDADLLVMGAWRHQRFSEWDSGTAVTQALSLGSLPMLLAH